MEQQISNIPTVKVLLHTKGEQIDLNTQGLVSLHFERYLSNPKNRSSNILTELDLTLFDSSGFSILGKVQSSGGNLFLEYGYDNNLSELYKITPTRYNVVQNNRGIMLGVGGFGVQYTPTVGAEYYKEGSNIRDIILFLAKRNGWNTNGGDYILLADTLTLPNAIHKEPGMLDFDFIQQKLIPILDSNTVYNKETKGLIKHHTGFYEATLEEDDYKLSLYVFPTNQKNYIKRTLWEYNYGTDTQSQIIELTNKINYDWIVNGLTLQVPLFPEDVILKEKELEKQYDELLTQLTEDIEAIFKEQGIAIPEYTNLTYKFDFYEPGADEPFRTRAEIIAEKIKEITERFNTMEMTIVGNPHIRATDVVKVVALNKEGMELIQNGYWRIVGIEENIGLGGYQTKLTLVRDTEAIKVLGGL